MIHSPWHLFFVEVGLEPIAVELSGGQFLPPVQKLVATLIFARPTQGQKCKSSPVTESVLAGTANGHRHQKKRGINWASVSK